MADDIVTRLRDAEDNGISEWQVLIDAADEIERLQRWKVEACSVLADWDAIYVSLGDRGELGQRKSAVVAAEIGRLRALVDHYKTGINWHTTCTNCAKLMDVNYDQYCEIDRLRAAGDQLADYVREAGPGLHDDMAILACWQEARRG